MGLLGSLGALLPAAVILFISDGWRQRVMPYLLSYATGTMLATAIIGLIPEALEHISIYEVGISILAGLVLFLCWSGQSFGDIRTGIRRKATLTIMDMGTTMPAGLRKKQGC